MRVLDSYQIRAVAVTALCATETVERYLEDRPVRPLSRLRIEGALRELGLAKRRKRAMPRRTAAA